MDATAGLVRPKHCSECGTRIGEKDGFCGGCGQAVGVITPAGRGETPRPISPSKSKGEALSASEETAPEASSLRRDAFVAALVLGGVWPLLNRLASRPLRTWVPLPFTALWALLSLAALQWWARFLLGRRGELSHGAAGLLAGLVVTLAVLSMLVSLPMAVRASRLLTERSAARQRGQTRWAAAILATTIAYGAWAASADRRVDEAVNEARYARNRAVALEHRGALLRALGDDMEGLELGDAARTTNALRRHLELVRSDYALEGFHYEGDPLTARERNTLESVLQQARYLSDVLSNETAREDRAGSPPRPGYWRGVVNEFDARRTAAVAAAGRP